MRTARALSVDPGFRSSRANRWANLTLAERFWGYVDKSDSCWVWIGRKNAKGYGTFGIRTGRNALAHRVSWSLVNGEIPPRAIVLHARGCTSRACVRPEHLRLGTQKDNVADTMALGRAWCQQGPPVWTGKPQLHARGEGNGSAKLTGDIVRQMRAVFAAGGVTMKSVGARFGVSPTQAQRILNGQSWRHLLTEGGT